jgi:hypothetical protein
MPSSSIRALATFVVVTLISWSCAALLGHFLPANRTSSTATAMILAAAVLAIGGPIIGLFLAINYYRRTTRDPHKPTVIQAILNDAQARRRYALIFVAVGLSVGSSLLILGLVMLIPAAWLAGGGDRPPGSMKPSELQGPITIFRGVIAMAVGGAALMLAAAVVGVILLLTREHKAR